MEPEQGYTVFNGGTIRAIGIFLILLGLLPIGGALWFWFWAHRMYTVGMSVDGRGILSLAVLIALDLWALAGGLYLLKVAACPKKGKTPNLVLVNWGSGPLEFWVEIAGPLTLHPNDKLCIEAGTLGSQKEFHINLRGDALEIYPPGWAKPGNIYVNDMLIDPWSPP